MSSQERKQRLREDFELLSELADHSAILQLQTRGDDPPDRYTLTFQGKGLARDPTSRADVKLIDQHRIELRLPYAYPDVAPDVRWLTAIFHPNISFSGFIRLQDVGISWDPPVALDVVCERLWDVACLRYYNLETTTNYHAKNWIEEQTQWELPVDRRPLRGAPDQARGNVVRYRHTDSGGIELQGAAGDDSVLFIGEDTPVPPLPPRRAPRTTRQDDDDVFYIGDE